MQRHTYTLRDMFRAIGSGGALIALFVLAGMDVNVACLCAIAASALLGGGLCLLSKWHQPRH
jgi:hypothetical protein